MSEVHMSNDMTELAITREMFAHKQAVFSRLFLELNLPECDMQTLKHQARVEKSDSNYIKVDFKGEIKGSSDSGDSDEVSRKTFVIEFQKGRANMDHAKALVYPLMDASCKIGIWIAEEYGEYIRKAVQNFNEELKENGYKFYLATYKFERGDIVFSKVVGPEVDNAEDEGGRQ